MLLVEKHRALSPSAGAHLWDQQSRKRHFRKPWHSLSLLGSGVLFASSFGIFCQTYSSLSVIVYICTALAIFLFGVSLINGIRSGSLGLVVLMGSTFIYYWADVLSLARTDPPFLVPLSMPIGLLQFAPRDLKAGLACLSVFQLTLIAGYTLPISARRIQSWMWDRHDRRSSAAVSLTVIAAFCSFSGVMSSYGVSFAAVKTAMLAARSPSDLDWQDPGLFQHLLGIGMFGSSLLIANSILRKGRLRIVLAAAGVCCASPLLLLGTRHQALFVALPLLLVTLFKIRGHMRASRLILLAAVLICSTLLIKVAGDIRTLGWTHLGELSVDQLTDFNPAGHFSAFLFSQDLVPGNHGFFYELAEPYFFLHWIPRALWASKPIMKSWAFFNNSWTGGAAFNVTPGIMAQYYMNFGFPGIPIAGLWLGILARVTDKIIIKADLKSQQCLIVLGGMFEAFLSCSFRFYHPLYFVYFGFGFLAFLALTVKHRRAA